MTYPGVYIMPWHTLAVGKCPGALGKCPGTLNSEFFIPWPLTGGRGNLGELKAKARVKAKVKVKAKNQGQKIICLELHETHEYGIKIFEKNFPSITDYPGQDLVSQRSARAISERSRPGQVTKF